jgi:RNA polymerase sigma-B factor
VPRRLQELSVAVGRATGDLTAELARRPTVPELAGRVGVSDDEVREAISTAAAYLPISLNRPVGVAGTAELGELIGLRDVAIDAVDDRLTVAALLCRLPPRERRLLALRFYGNRSQVQIAQELGISQMHVSRLLSRALSWLREAMISDTPPQWDAGRPQPAGQLLTVHTRAVGATTVVEVIGEVDRDTAPRLRERLLDAIGRAEEAVRVDLSRVPFLDAAGAAAIVTARRAAHRRGVPLQLSSPQRYVRHVLHLAGVRLPGAAPAG